MWYKYAQVDENIVNQWLKKINDAQNIPDIEERDAAINLLVLEYFNEFGMGNETYRKLIYEPLNKIHQQSIADAIRSYKEKRNQERQVSGEPELDLGDIYTFPEWIQWIKKTQGSLSEYDLPYLISALNQQYSIYNNYIFKNLEKGSYGHAKREVIDPEDKEFILNLRNNLQNEAFNILGIDKNKLSDPELWKVESVGDFEKSLELVKQIHWVPYEDAEGTLLTFAINPNGISIIAEVSDPMPINLQKNELLKFINDVNQFAPKSWDKDIKYIEGGDFADMLSGKLDQNIKVYRMMSDQEYESWQRGAIIPQGKYFALKKELAVGTDFAGEGFKNVFTFITNRSLMTGIEDNIVVNNVPLYLKDNKLLPLT